MDIKELESLSCLRLKEDDRENLRKDLNNVLKMMHEIDALPVNKELTKMSENSIFMEVKSEFIEKNSNTLNLHADKFLAPKVIKK